MDIGRDLVAVATGLWFLDAALAVIHQRCIEEARPAVQHIDHLAREILESPALVSSDRQRLVLAIERVIEVDHTFDEARGENAHASEIQQVHAAVVPYRIVAEMRVAVNDAVVVEGYVPGVKHIARDLVALAERRLGSLEERRALEPSHGEKPARRELRQHLGHVHMPLARERQPIEPEMRGLAEIVELLAEPRRDLLVD